MKLSDALSLYRGYRQELIGQRKELIRQRDTAQAQYEATRDAAFSQEAATLQLSIDAANEEFLKNQDVLDDLTEQWAAAANAENARALADPETGLAAIYAKIMTTAMRMARGDLVPASDEQKLAEYSQDLYQMAKQAQMLAMNEKSKKHKSLWDDEEETQDYDPEGVADNTEAQGDLPEIPSGDTTEAAAGGHAETAAEA